MPAPRDAVAALRAKAMTRGYEVERAIFRERVHLVGPSGEREINPARNNTLWSMQEARRFLDRLPDPDS